MTFTEAVARVEKSLMEIGLKFKSGEQMPPEVMTMKLDCYFKDAWSNAVDAYMKNEISAEELSMAGLEPTVKLTTIIHRRRTFSTLSKIDQEMSE